MAIATVGLEPPVVALPRGTAPPAPTSRETAMQELVRLVRPSHQKRPAAASLSMSLPTGLPAAGGCSGRSCAALHQLQAQHRSMPAAGAGVGAATRRRAPSTGKYSGNTVAGAGAGDGDETGDGSRPIFAATQPPPAVKGRGGPGQGWGTSTFQSFQGSPTCAITTQSTAAAAAASAAAAARSRSTGRVVHSGGDSQERGGGRQEATSIPASPSPPPAAPSPSPSPGNTSLWSSPSPSPSPVMRGRPRREGVRQHQLQQQQQQQQQQTLFQQEQQQWLLHHSQLQQKQRTAWRTQTTAPSGWHCIHTNSSSGNSPAEATKPEEPELGTSNLEEVPSNCTTQLPGPLRSEPETANLFFDGEGVTVTSYLSAATAGEATAAGERIQDDEEDEDDDDEDDIEDDENDEEEDDEDGHEGEIDGDRRAERGQAQSSWTQPGQGGQMAHPSIHPVKSVLTRSTRPGAGLALLAESNGKASAVALVRRLDPQAKPKHLLDAALLSATMSQQQGATSSQPGATATATGSSFDKNWPYTAEGEASEAFNKAWPARLSPGTRAIRTKVWREVPARGSRQRAPPHLPFASFANATVKIPSFPSSFASASTSSTPTTTTTTTTTATAASEPEPPAPPPPLHHLHLSLRRRSGCGEAPLSVPAAATVPGCLPDEEEEEEAAQLQHQQQHQQQQQRQQRQNPKTPNPNQPDQHTKQHSRTNIENGQAFTALKLIEPEESWLLPSPEEVSSPERFACPNDYARETRARLRRQLQPSEGQTAARIAIVGAGPVGLWIGVLIARQHARLSRQGNAVRVSKLPGSPSIDVFERRGDVTGYGSRKIILAMSDATQSLLNRHLTGASQLTAKHSFAPTCSINFLETTLREEFQRYADNGFGKLALEAPVDDPEELLRDHDVVFLASGRNYPSESWRAQRGLAIAISRSDHSLILEFRRDSTSKGARQLLDLQSACAAFESSMRGSVAIYLRPGPTEDVGWLWLVGLGKKLASRLSNRIASAPKKVAYGSFAEAWRAIAVKSPSNSNSSSNGNSNSNSNSSDGINMTRSPEEKGACAAEEDPTHSGEEKAKNPEKEGAAEEKEEEGEKLEAHKGAAHSDEREDRGDDEDQEDQEDEEQDEEREEEAKDDLPEAAPAAEQMARKKKDKRNPDKVPKVKTAKLPNRVCPLNFFEYLDKELKVESASARVVEASFWGCSQVVHRTTRPDGSPGWIVVVGDAACGRPFYLGSTLNGHLHDTVSLQQAPWKSWNGAGDLAFGPFQAYQEQYRRRTEVGGFRACSRTGSAMR